MRDGAAYLVLLGSALAFPAQAADPQTVIEPILLLQTWATVFDQDLDPQADPAGYGDPEADPGFTLRRARAGLSVERGVLEARVSFGMSAPSDVFGDADPSIGVVDAYGGGRWTLGPGELGVSLGRRKVPISREELISSSDLLFQERAVFVNHTVPGRELGALLDYEADFGGRVRAGVFNGNGSLLGDDNPGVLGAGRVEFAHGDAYRTFSHDQESAFGVAVSGMLNDDVATRTVQGSADALVRVSMFSAMVEANWSRITPTHTSVDEPEVEVETVRLGALAQVGAFVPLEYGGVEIGVRGELFDDDTAVRNNGDVALLTYGASWRDLAPGLDVGAGFIQRLELEGRTIPNNTARLWLQAELPTR